MDIADFALQVGTLSRRRDDMKRRVGMGMLDELMSRNPEAVTTLVGGRMPGRGGVGAAALRSTMLPTGGGAGVAPGTAPGGGGGGGGNQSNQAPWDWGSGEPFIDRRAEQMKSLALAGAENEYAMSNLAREDAYRASADADRQRAENYKEGAQIVKRFSGAQLAVPQGNFSPAAQDEYEYGAALMVYKDPIKARAAVNAKYDKSRTLTAPEAAVQSATIRGDALVKAAQAKNAPRGGLTESERLTRMAGLMDSIKGIKPEEATPEQLAMLKNVEQEVKNLSAAGGKTSPENLLPESMEIAPGSFTNDPMKMMAAMAAKRLQGLPAVGPKETVPSHVPGGTLPAGGASDAGSITGAPMGAPHLNGAQATSAGTTMSATTSATDAIISSWDKERAAGSKAGEGSSGGPTGATPQQSKEAQGAAKSEEANEKAKNKKKGKKGGGSKK